MLIMTNLKQIVRSKRTWVVALLAGLVVASVGIAGADGGLISHWKADGNAQDSAGNNHGTLVGGTTFASGIYDQAFSFDGVNDLVLVPDSPSLNPTTAITLAAWVQVTGKQGLDRDIVSKDGELFDRQYLLTASNVNRFRAHVGTSSTTSGPTCVTIPYDSSGLHVFDGATPVDLDEWYHVAMTYDGSTLKLYVNGVLDGSCSVSGTIITTIQPVRIGGGAPLGNATLHFEGLADDVKIFDFALSPSEVQGEFQAGLDSDDDGVLDSDDVCAGTVYPDGVPTVSLWVNRWADVDGDGVFDTTPPKGKAPKRSYTVQDTAGCSAAQIIDALGLGKGHTKFGVSNGAMDKWVAGVNP